MKGRRQKMPGITFLRGVQRSLVCAALTSEVFSFERERERGVTEFLACSLCKP